MDVRLKSMIAAVSSVRLLAWPESPVSPGGWVTIGSILALLSGTYAGVDHNHDAVYALVDHNHDTDYSTINHDHDGLYLTESEILALPGIGGGVGLPVGLSALWFASVPPAGWLFGSQNVSREEYSALFALFGTGFGVGDGSTTFGLPAVSDYFPVFAGGAYGLGSTGGANAVTLTQSTIPSHGKHVVNTYTNIGIGGSTEVPKGGNILDIGGGLSHENRPPYFGVNLIIYSGVL